MEQPEEEYKVAPKEIKIEEPPKQNTYFKAFLYVVYQIFRDCGVQFSNYEIDFEEFSKDSLSGDIIEIIQNAIDQYYETYDSAGEYIKSVFKIKLDNIAKNLIEDNLNQQIVNLTNWRNDKFSYLEPDICEVN